MSGKDEISWTLCIDETQDLSQDPDKSVRDLYERIKEAHRIQFIDRFKKEPQIPFEDFRVNCIRLVETAKRERRNFDSFLFNFDKGTLFCKWAQ